MTEYKKAIEIRWSDLDPNLHVRHSAYYDFGAYCRICFLTENGLTTTLMLEHKLGPVLLREECVFRREISFGDVVTINVTLKTITPDYKRWTMVHEIYKNDKVLSAIITVDGAWIDTERRKLTTPPSFASETFDKIPKTIDFVIS